LVVKIFNTVDEGVLRSARNEVEILKSFYRNSSTVLFVDYFEH